MKKLDLLQKFNQVYAETNPQKSELDARLTSYELAFRTQANAPEAIDLSKETEGTQKLYGSDKQETEVYARRCLLARRLVGRGARFIQLFSGGNHNDANWDAHGDLEHVEPIHELIG